jgi:hypothetical protein
MLVPGGSPLQTWRMLYKLWSILLACIEVTWQRSSKVVTKLSCRRSIMLLMVTVMTMIQILQEANAYTER